MLRNKQKILNELNGDTWLWLFDVARRRASWHDAEDICQVVFVKALRRIHLLNGPSHVRGWLVTVLRWVLACHYKYGNYDREKRINFLELIDPVTFDSYLSCNLAPVIIAINNEEKEMLRGKIQVMRPLDRQILKEYYMEGLSCIEISRKLKVNARTIQTRLQAARKRLAVTITL